MTPFAFIIHPIEPADVARKYPLARLLPTALLEAIMARTSAKLVSEITGVRSPTGAETRGWFVGCPLTTRQLAEGDPGGRRQVIGAWPRPGRRSSARAFTAIVGDGGRKGGQAGYRGDHRQQLHRRHRGRGHAAGRRAHGDRPGAGHWAVLGATGSIGRICAHLPPTRCPAPPHRPQPRRARRGGPELAERQIQVEIGSQPGGGVAGG